MANQIGSKRTIAYCLLGLASVSRSEGRDTHAAQLIGASKKLFLEMQGQMESLAAESYDRTEAALAQVLDPKDLRRALAEGAAMPVDEVVSLVLARSP